MASAHAPCPRAIHVVYPDSLTRHLTCIPHAARLLLAPTALVAVLSSAIGSFPPTLPVVQRAVSTCHIHLVYSHSPDRLPQYHRRSHPSRAKPLPHAGRNSPTHVRKDQILIISSTRTHPTVTRNTTDALTPHEQSPSPHRGRSLPRTSARVHVPCVCRASRQHQLRAIDRSARRTRRSSVDGGRVLRRYRRYDERCTAALEEGAGCRR